MDLTYIFQSVDVIKPEIAVSAALVLILLFDLIFHHNKKLIPFVALIGIFVSGYFVVEQLNITGTGFSFSDSPSADYGMITVDSFGAFFKLIVLLTTLIIVFFTWTSKEIKECNDRLGEYYTLIFGMILGMFLMISASDLILVYLSLELMSLSSYVLAGFIKLRDRSSEAGLKYLLYGAVSSGLLLFGISIIYGMTGTTNLDLLNSLLQSSGLNQLTLNFALILIFAGIGYKISTAPFHFWTPDVYEGAPISITAYLSVASKAAGFALLIRFIKTTFVSYIDINGLWKLTEVFDWQSLLIIISIFTMTLGNFSALWQSNIKRMLAYSSIAHAGYILLGVLVLSNQGLTAVLIYFFVYLLMNLGAFFVVMIIANKTGSEELDDYNGLGYTSPFLCASLSIFLISLTGLPPTAGFIGKLYLFIALVDVKMFAVAVIALLNTVVSLYYYVRVLKHMYLTKSTDLTPVVSSPFPVTLIVLLLLVPVFFFGIYFTPLVEFAKSCISTLGI